MKFEFKHGVTALALCAAAFTSSAQAGYSQIIAFGDSLSDNGNLFAMVGQPPAPYYQGRFSNGPVAVEVMAQELGLPLADTAFGGARTDLGNSGSPLLNGTGVQGQVARFGQALAAANTTADSSALYFVWAGPNDFFSTPTADWGNTAITAAANIKADIYSLYQLGARDFFVPLMPDLGLTPSARAQDAAQPGASAYASARSAQFNSLLAASLDTINSSWDGAHVYTFDTMSFLQSAVQTLAPMGFNVTDSCFSSGTVCADPDHYIFWDGVHPTAAAHSLLGEAFAAAVPEASTNVMIGLGLVFTLAVARRKARSQYEVA